MGKDYYEILGVDKKADDAALKKGAGARQCPLSDSLLPLRCPRWHMPHLLSMSVRLAPYAQTGAGDKIYMAAELSSVCVAYRKLAIKWHPVRSLPLRFYAVQYMIESCSPMCGMTISP